MLIITSPAKRLDEKKPFPKIETTIPRSMEKTVKLHSILKKKSGTALARLFEVNNNIGKLNKARFQKWTPEHNLENSRPSTFMYLGDVHREIKAREYTKEQLVYLFDNVRFLSAFYGVTRPTDLIQPYRLMMGSRMKIGKYKNLYDFWKEETTKLLNEDLKKTKSKYLIDLASDEYSETVDFDSINAKVIHIEFRQIRGKKLMNIGTLNKKSRGIMIDYMIRNNVQTVGELVKFDSVGYNLHLQTDNTLIFKTKKL